MIVSSHSHYTDTAADLGFFREKNKKKKAFFSELFVAEKNELRDSLK